MSNEDNSRLDNLNQELQSSNPTERQLTKTFCPQNSIGAENLKKIQCRIEFVNIGEVDTFHEQFKAYVIVRSRWFENEKIEEYDSEKHWNPKLYIQNLLPEKFFENVSYNLKQHEHCTEIIEIRSCKGTFWERMELMDFPLDIQELSIIVESNHNPRHVRVIPDDEKISCMSSDTLSSFRDQQKFTLYQMVRVSDTASYDEPHNTLHNRENQCLIEMSSKFARRSKHVATCLVSRNPGYYIVNVYSFNCLITILTLTLFIINVEGADKRILGTFKLILTLFTFKIVTSKALPTISYLTSLDKYQMINIAYLALCCLWHSLICSLDIKLANKIAIDKSAFGLLVTFFIAVQLVFTFSFWKSYQKIKKLKTEQVEYIKECARNKQNLEEYDDD